MPSDLSRSAKWNTHITDADSTLCQSIERLTLATQPTNVVLFGEPGVGKSAVVNLIARRNIAKVPSGVRSRTLQSARYDIDDMNLRIFEIVGLDEQVMNGNSYLAALENAYHFVNMLNGVHLLLFCLRANRITTTMRSNYRLFFEVVFQKMAPLALVITGLEEEAKMEAWWTRNKAAIERCGLMSHGHACITTVTNRTPLQDYNYTESQKRICELLKSCCLKTPAPLPHPYDSFVRLGTGIQQFVEKDRKPTQADITNTLTRLGLGRKEVQGFLDVTERGDTQLHGRGGMDSSHGVPSMSTSPGDSKGEYDPRKSNTTGGGHALDLGRPGESPRRAMAGVGVAQTQSRYPEAAVEGGRSGNWGSGARREGMTSGNVPERVNELYIKSAVSVSMEDIRSNFPHDLTGHVTKAKRHPFASGSYGDIYRGKFSIDGRSSIDVAIKVYRMYLDHDGNLPERMRRFHREIVVWVKLRHPNVLELFGTVRDPDMHPDLPAMVCAWAENGALSGYLEKYKNMTVGTRLFLVNDVAHGLQYLHSQHVVHGDLSGSNVLVRANGSACIGDFGLSTLSTKVGGVSFPTSRQNKGTVRWMAPELLDPHDTPAIPTQGSDVYSFGSVMLQILTGDVPYHHLSRDEQVIYAIIQGRRPERSGQRAVTESRWRFIERCWANKERPSSDMIVEFTVRELSETTPFGF